MHPAQASRRRSDSNYVLRSAPGIGAGCPQVHSPRPMVAASSLSIGSGRLSSSSSSQAHLTTSARFRVRARVPVSGRLSTTTSWRGPSQLPWFPGAFPPPAFASWSSCSRQGVGPSSRSAYRPVNTGRTQTGFPRSARTSYDRGGCPLYPGGRRCSPGLATITSPRLPHLNGTSLDPATTSIHARLCLTRHQRGFKPFTRPVFPSPVAPGWNGRPWTFPRASHPALTSDARRGGDRPPSTDPKQRSMSST